MNTRLGTMITMAP